MKILLVGSGGREHAIAWKLAESARVEKIYCVPGNCGIKDEAECLSLDVITPSSLADLATRLEIDLTIVGPELPLVAGVVDCFQRRHLNIVGPTRAAAQLEGSKAFAKEFMSRHRIPTAAFTICDTAEAAYDMLNTRIYSYPMVLKADGLAAGKGVVIAHDEAEARRTIREFMEEKKLGEAGAKLVIEEYLPGREASLLVFSDGKNLLPMPPAQDYKNIFDGNKGPNTGGMGSFSMPGLLERTLKEKILREIAEPTIAGMAADGTPFKGILYIGLMITEDGPQVLEYNVRFGDPETQVILARLDSDLVDIFEGIAKGDITNIKPFWSEMSSVCVVMAAAGYPGQVQTGDLITGIAEAEALEGVKIFQAGTKRNESGELITDGGRVLGVMARQLTLEAARAQAYRAVACIKFAEQHYRQDIALNGNL